VVGLPSLNINKDGDDIASLTDVEVIILDGQAGSRTVVNSLAAITTDTSGNTGTVEVPSPNVTNGDSVLAVVYTPTTPVGIAFTRALELI